MNAAPGWLRLESLPRGERRDALAEIVSGELRSVLQMEPAEALPFDQSFFDLGLTSLSVEETKERIEQHFGCRIDAQALFNHPTVADLLEHLEHEPLAPLFAGSAAAPAAAAPDATEKALVDDMLDRLFRG